MTPLDELVFTELVPTLLVAPPGIGKTAYVDAQFEHVERLLVSSMVEEDIAGLPYVQDGEERRAAPPWLTRLLDAESKGLSCCLFLDELDKARRAVADTLLTLVANRLVGSVRLPDSICIVAAANPPSSSGGDGISVAMLSRFAVVPVSPSVTGWVQWARQEFAEHASVHGIIDAVACGEIPLYDESGEDFDRRITCPRTIGLAMMAICKIGTRSQSIVSGLVTAGVASFMMSLIRQEDSDVFQTTRRHVRTHNKSAQKGGPIRL